MTALQPLIGSRILTLREQRVVIDADLAELYGVQTRVLVQAVKRNLSRFPADFMFQLSTEEFANLRSQSVISSAAAPAGHGGRRTAPYAFTEHGAIMAASILNTPQATELSVYVVRTFVRMREAISAHKVLAAKLAQLERRVDSQDETIVEILAAIRQLMTPPEPRKKRGIGFLAPLEK